MLPISHQQFSGNNQRRKNDWPPNENSFSKFLLSQALQFVILISQPLFDFTKEKNKLYKTLKSKVH